MLLRGLKHVHGLATPEPGSPAKTSSGRGLVAALALTAAVYAPTLWSYFQKDDWGHLLRASTPGIDSWAFGEWFYRPLFLEAFRGMYRLFGLNALPWHVTTLSVHLANVALLYWFARRLRLSSIAATVGAILFGVYPTNPDAVAWLSACSGTIAVFFGLIAAHIAISTRIPPILRGLLCASVWTIGIFAKEDVAALILILPFLPLFAGGKQSRGDLAKWFSSCVMLAVGLFLFQRMESSCHQTYGNPTATLTPQLARHAAAFTVFAMRNAIPLFMTSTYWGAALLTIVPIIVWKRCPDLRLGLLWFFGTCMAIGVATGYLAPTDRYYYLPSIGIALFLAALYDRLSARREGPSFGSWFVLGAFVFALTSTPWEPAGWLTAAALAIWYWIDSARSGRNQNACLWMVGCALTLRLAENLGTELGWGYVNDWVWLAAPFVLISLFALRGERGSDLTQAALCGCVAFWLAPAQYTLLLAALLAVELFRRGLVSHVRLPEVFVERLHSCRKHRALVLATIVIAASVASSLAWNLQWLTDGRTAQKMAAREAAFYRSLPHGAVARIVERGSDYGEPRAHNVIVRLIARRPDLQLRVRIVNSDR